MTYDEAEAYCQSQGSTLATIRNSADRDAAKALCQTYNNVDSRGCWIGLKSAGDSENWAWEDGSPLDYGFLSNGDPNVGVDPWWRG